MVDPNQEKYVNNNKKEKFTTGENKMCTLTNIESRIKEINLKIDEITKISQKFN